MTTFKIKKSTGIRIIQIIIYGIVLAGLAQILYLDAFNLTDTGTFGENSYTEWTQVIFLVLIISISIIIGKLIKEQKPLMTAFAAFFAMAITREFDMYLDNNVFDGAWQVIVFTILGITLIFVYRNWQAFIKNLDYFFNTTAFGMILSGWLITFVFSRLYGRSVFWQAVAGDNYIRAIKNVSEEGIELLGYVIIFLGLIEYLRMVLKSE